MLLIILALSACNSPGPLHQDPTPRTGQPVDAPTLAQALTAPAKRKSDPDSSSSAALPTPSRQPADRLSSPTDPTLPSAAPTEALSYRYWRWWPVLPAATQTTRAVYQRGLELDLDRHAFSIVGDCQSMPAVFGGRYDHPGQFQLPAEYAYLQETIDRFAGSFDRSSVTVQNGFSATAALSPLWADPEVCNAGETPLDCELRLHRPVFVFIALGSNWNSGDAERHSEFFEQIVDRVIAAGAVPILSTKGDNEEGDGSINLGIAELAADRDLPLWNFWRAIQGLPNHGLDEGRNGNYLSTAAWDVRGFTALQALDTLWRQLDPDGR
jgi:hypothetical protein